MENPVRAILKLSLRKDLMILPSWRMMTKNLRRPFLRLRLIEFWEQAKTPSIFTIIRHIVWLLKAKGLQCGHAKLVLVNVIR